MHLLPDWKKEIHQLILNIYHKRYCIVLNYFGTIHLIFLEYFGFIVHKPTGKLAVISDLKGLKIGRGYYGMYPTRNLNPNFPCFK